jgi:hypothetical protein
MTYPKTMRWDFEKCEPADGADIDGDESAGSSGGQRRLVGFTDGVAWEEVTKKQQYCSKYGHLEKDGFCVICEAKRL